METATIESRYEITGQPVRGVFFDAYPGRDWLQEQPVVIYSLREPRNLSLVEMQQVAAEARRAQELTHLQILAVRDVRLTDGRLLIVTENPRGQTLNQLLHREGPLPPERAVALVLQLCQALQYAHEQGVLHGAMDTRSVFVGKQSDVLLGDFGTHGALGRTPCTAAYVRRQRVVFISPEEARGRNPDKRSDVYALGVILYQMLCGRPPFQDADPLAVARAHCDTPVSFPAALRAAVPKPSQEITLTALAKDPEERYASVRELRTELRNFADRVFPKALVQPAPPESPPPVPATELARKAASSPTPAAAVVVEVPAKAPQVAAPASKRVTVQRTRPVRAVGDEDSLPSLLGAILPPNAVKSTLPKDSTVSQKPEGEKSAST